MPEPLDEYTTVRETEDVEKVIKKSRFIASCYPVSSREEADQIISELRKRHYKANHVCSAYVLATTPEMLKSSDDGEPSGTAGLPILEVIQKNNLKNTLVAVVRYFGGIKLGTGGLIRAYSGAASDLIKQAEKLHYSKYLEIEITIEYGYYNQLKNVLDNDKRFFLTEENFTDLITLKFFIRPEEEDDFTRLLNDITGGNILIETNGIKTLGIKI